jgi:N6-adenosine-specific RNA methylase IME4
MGVMKAVVKSNGGEQQLKFDLRLPGTLTRTGWELPQKLSFEDWIACGQSLGKIEVAVQWWLGDWWAYGEHAYGERKALFEEGGPLEDMSFNSLAHYGWIARSIETCNRLQVLSFKHHEYVAPFSPAQQRKWLERAVKGDDGKKWSSNQLKAAIARYAAIEKTVAVDLEAQKLGKFAVLYADPPWQYEYPPMGGSNRSIENHYPTMTIEEICALPVVDIAHENSVLFMWATSPKLYECMKVLDAWGFQYRTDMVWVKDKIGMGYHARERHEALLIAKRGELPPPPPEARPDSVQEQPRLEHSAKPEIFYDLIDRMYPEIRKIELFSRAPAARKLWTVWGNQAVAA